MARQKAVKMAALLEMHLVAQMVVPKAENLAAN